MAKKLTRAHFFFHLMCAGGAYSEKYKKTGREPTMDSILDPRPLPQTQFVWNALQHAHTNEPLAALAYAEMAWEEYEKEDKAAA